MKTTWGLFVFGCWVLVSLNLQAQSFSIPKSEYDLSINSFGATAPNRVPFWLYANQYGIIPSTTPSFIPRAAFSNIKGDTIQENWSSLRLIYGIDAAVIIDKVISRARLIEGFAGLRYGAFEAYLGRRRETVGLLGDTLMSSGAYSWSGNAPPFVKLQISLPNYTNVPFTGGFLAVKGSFSHGWLDTLAVGYGGQGVLRVKGYLHQKTFYLKMGKPHWKINMIAGFNHQAQWGGEDQIWPNGLPAREAWWAVVVGRPWEGSRVGNHLGTIDLGLSWSLQENKSLFFYRQNIFDDGSLYKLNNIKDGLTGIVFTNHQSQDFTRTITLQKVLFEFLNTTNQGGDVFDFAAGVFGRDNYFNHYLYSQGWSYKDQMIGTPFISKQTDLQSTIAPVKNVITNNNRVKMVHFSLSGWLDDWQWLLKTSYSINYGLYDYPFKASKNQLSTLIQFQKELPWLRGIDWRTSIAFDSGSLYDNSVGFQIGLRKRGFFK
jgi:hypothetical protein